MNPALLWLLIMIALFTVWHFFVKPDLDEVISDSVGANPIVALVSTLVPKATAKQAKEWVLGVVGIVIFFVIGAIL